jgi:hypothetical protein
VPDGKPSGVVDRNGLFSEMDTARNWGLNPDEWYTKSRAARAMMIATSAMRARIDNVMADNG